MGTSDSPLQMPARRFTADEKQHRSNNQALEQFGNFSFFGFIPVGGIVGYGGNSAPPGFVRANGAALNRRAYKELFSIYGTTYGAGDGSTTFNIPTQAQARAIFGGTGGEAANGFMIIRTGVF